MEGKVQTVLGPVEPSKLGHVLTHEHFTIDVEKVFRKPPLVKPEMECCDFSLKNIGWIRQYPYSHKPNMRVEGSEDQVSILEELKYFKSIGGGTIVENTTTGIQVPGRSLLLRELSEKSGVHIVAGTGFYVDGSQKESTLALSEEELANIMRKDIVEGADEDKTIKSGIIGEVGCSWPITEFERKSIRASAAVERDLGCPVMAHPGREKVAPEEIVRVYCEAGGNPRRLVMAHLDRTIHTKEELLEFASLGTFLEYDLFGIETSYYQQNEEISMPSDAQRIERIKMLIDEGFAGRTLISHDIHTRHRFAAYGGHGFSHISTVILPMMLQRGISKETLHQITVLNPASWLSFV